MATTEDCPAPLILWPSFSYTAGVCIYCGYVGGQTTVLENEADLDVDSDNNNGDGLPDRSMAEDMVETTQPGKLLCLNDDDDDNNGDPDKDQEPPPVDSDLVRMVMDLASNDAGGKWRLQYNALMVQVYEDDRAMIVLPNTIFDLPVTPTSKTFWVEGLAITSEGPTSLTLEMDLEGDGTFECTDTVVVTTPSDYDTVEIQYKTFIGCEVLGPTLWGDPTLFDFFAGDNRTYGYGFSANASRTFQQTSLTVDPSNTNSGQADDILQRNGIARGYDDHPDFSDVVLLPAPTCGGFCSYMFVPGATAECTAQVPNPGDDGQLSMGFVRRGSAVDLMTVRDS